MKTNSGLTMDTSSDVQLLELSLRGDREAFGQLVARYQSLICSLAYSACGDLARSEDVAQETFLTAWRHLADLRERTKFKSWLCGIARNLINNSLRRQARDGTRGPEPLESIPEPMSTMPSPRDQAISREEESIVWRTLAEIPETYREPLVLFYREQQSVAEVATALELSEDAVKQRLSRGRALLKEQVATLVETTLRKTKPGKAFTIAVLVSLPAIVPQATAAGLAAGAAKGSAAAKSAAALGLSGAVLGPLIGVLGGYIGVRASIKNTKTPRERQFVVRQTWWVLGYVIAFFLAMSLVMTFGKKLLPAHVGWFVALILVLVEGYAVGLIALILRSNRRQRQIQIEDGTYVAPGELQATLLKSSPAKVRRGIYGGLAGSIFGSMSFAVILAGQHHDWISVGVLGVMASALFFLGAKRALRNPLKNLRVLIVTPVSAAILSLIVVDFRWSTWMAGSPISRPAEHWSLIGMNVFMVLLFAFIGFSIFWNQRLDRKPPSPPRSSDQASPRSP
jgi:RNA polymerase sigma factor (sigma-70 family)